MNENTLKINNSFIVNAMRNCGYTNYTAIADIIDNSIEPDVGAKHVIIDTEVSGKGADIKIEAINIIDDGSGMPLETLKEAMCLGAETGKNPINNLGMYGAGLKTAAFSIGQTLEVYTKTDSGNVEYAVISLKPFISRESDQILVKYNTFEKDTNEYKTFIKDIQRKNKKADSGTVVRISNLDKIQNTTDEQFRNKVKYQVADTFNKYISIGKDHIKFYVRNDEIPYTDFIGDCSQEIRHGEFNIQDCVIKWKAWRISNATKDDEDTKRKSTRTTEASSHNISEDGKKYMVPISSRYQGFYVYRQNRLIGRGLTLGMWSRHPSVNNFRCELFADGNCDKIFGSTFTKILSEQEADHISKALHDAIQQQILNLTEEITKAWDREQREKDQNDPDKKKQNDLLYNNVAKDLNSNLMLGIKRRGVNEKRATTIEHKPIGPQKNPPLTRNRYNKWIDGFEERSLGKNEQRFIPEHRDNKLYIIINTDHQFYKEFYDKLPLDLKATAAAMLACDEIAKTHVNYYGCADVKNWIDQYSEKLSDEINKALN